MTRRAAFLLLTLTPVFLTPLSGQSQLPGFGAEALSGRKLTMPAAVQGHPALLVIGFTHGSGPHCADWAKRLETEFKGNAALERYTVIFLEDAPRMVRGMAKAGIKSGTPKEQFDRYLIVTEHEKEVKDALHFQAADDAYLALLGTDGTVKWTFHGPVGDDPIRQLRELLH